MNVYDHHKLEQALWKYPFRGDYFTWATLRSEVVTSSRNNVHENIIRCQRHTTAVCVSIFIDKSSLRRMPSWFQMFVLSFFSSGWTDFLCFIDIFRMLISNLSPLQANLKSFHKFIWIFFIKPVFFRSLSHVYVELILKFYTKAPILSMMKPLISKENLSCSVFFECENWTAK